jgi:polyisoprenoid-binding protein YceI
VANRAASLTFLALVLTAAPLVAQRTAIPLHVDDAASRIYVVTHRTGLLSFLGHEHAILAQKWTADVCLDAPSHAASRATLSIDARALDIDADSARALAGLGGGPSNKQRTQIYAKLHGAKGLATSQYPEIRFETVSVAEPESGKLRIRGRMTIKGVTREIELPVTVQRHDSGQMVFAGKTSFRQSDFGIRPESIAGVVKVSDVVDLHLSIVGRPAVALCLP